MEEKIKSELVNCSWFKEDIVDYLLKFYLDKIEDPSSFKERINLIKSLIKDHNITDTFIIVKEKLGIDLNQPLKIELRSCLVYIKYLITNNINKAILELKDDKVFLEKLFIRISLLKSGWKEYSIENFIKRNYKSNYGLKHYELYYIIFKKLLNIKEDVKCKGRPSFPKDVKNIIQGYRNRKNKEIMTFKYNISKELNKLFTKEDIKELYTLVDLSNYSNKNILKNKLDTLCKYT